MSLKKHQFLIVKRDLAPIRLILTTLTFSCNAALAMTHYNTVWLFSNLSSKSENMTTKNHLSRLIVASFTSVIFVATNSICVAQEAVNFARDIKPILAENCFACHGTDAETRAADLRLDDRNAAIEAGAIEPNDAEASSLVDRLYEQDPDAIMPPPKSGKKLTDAEKNLLKRWVNEGAQYTKHWSLVAPHKREPTNVKNDSWARNEIDRFVLARLEAEGLTPADDADARTLFRRLSLDITGLPPSVADAAIFESDFGDQGDEAVSAWIDKLMARLSWGEHRARYWLDAARYADTHGMHFDNYREMWPYRDWVIKAYNKNMPFDQFTIEQLAGDLLQDPTDDQLIATGFQRCNMTTNEGGTIDAENRAIYSADRVQTFGWVYLGLTTNCCQCHDHEFDPISMKDYYSLAAFFRNTTEPAKDGNVKDGKGATLKVFSDAQQKRLDEIKTELAKAKKKRDEYRDESMDKFQSWVVSLSNNQEAIPKSKSTVTPILQVPLNEGSGNQIAGLVGLESPVVSKKDLKWQDNGKFGPAVLLKKDQTINLGTIRDFSFKDPFSFGVWTKAQRKLGGAAIIAKMDEGAKHRGWDLYHQNGQYAVHIIDSWPENALKVRTKKAVFKKGKWEHVVATYDGSGKPEGIRIYLDGKLQETETEKNTLKPDAKLNTKTPLKVGQRSGGALYDGGMVQDVRIYDSALSAEDVKAEMESVGDYFKMLIAIPADQRTDSQKEILANYYFAKVDLTFPSLTKVVTDLDSEKSKIRKSAPITHIQKEKPASMAKTRILMRGAYDKPGDEVSAATPEVLHAMQADAPRNRLGLAQWVIDPANPLTARVTVNRCWQELFGHGIVATSEDFGVMGTPPSNQDLLDWLAVDFRESGWDVKRLYKMILMSSTYRQAANVTPEKLAKDEDNSLMSRGPRFRMDGEMVRDYALSASGLINNKMYGRGAKPYQPPGIWEVIGMPESDTRKYVQDKGDAVYRRSLYSFWKRMSPPANLEAFNAPNREVCTVRRERTNTPLQALVTLNDPQFFEAARVLAAKGIKAGNGDWDSVLGFITQRTVCRHFNVTETRIVKEDYNAFFDHYRENPDEAKKLIAVGQTKADESLDAAELASWTWFAISC